MQIHTTGRRLDTRQMKPRICYARLDEYRRSDVGYQQNAPKLAGLQKESELWVSMTNRRSHPDCLEVVEAAMGHCS